MNATGIGIDDSQNRFHLNPSLDRRNKKGINALRLIWRTDALKVQS